MRLPAALFALSLTSVAPLQAQRRATPAFPSSEPGPSFRPAPPERLDLLPTAAPEPDQEPALAGLALAGLIGAVAGAAMGGRIGGSCEDLGCGGTVVVGLLAGESLGLAAGVHLASGSRGSLAESFLASLAIRGGGLAAAALAGRGAILLAVPLLQLAAAIDIERD